MNKGGIDKLKKKKKTIDKNTGEHVRVMESNIKISKRRRSSSRVSFS